jgi:hypothetical protein
VQVQAWNKNNVLADEHLATGVTAADGSYNLCFDGVGDSLFDGG